MQLTPAQARVSLLPGPTTIEPVSNCSALTLLPCALHREVWPYKTPAIALEDKVPPVRNESTDGQRTAAGSQKQGAGRELPSGAQGIFGCPPGPGRDP